jgi:hypothetical protein
MQTDKKESKMNSLINHWVLKSKQKENFMIYESRERGDLKDNAKNTHWH